MATSSITANFYTDDPNAAINIVRALFTNVQPSRGLPASLMPCEFKTPAAKRAFIMKAVRRARECQSA